MSRRAPRIGLIVSALLGLSILIMLAQLSLRFDHSLDWTANGRHSLSAASLRVLDSLDGPVSASAWLIPSAETQREIRARFAPYLRHKADFSLDIIDPARQPHRARELGISDNAEVVIEYQGRREHLTSLSEADISAALQRLAHSGQTRLAFVRGHGERDPQATDPQGYAALSRALGDKGLRISTLTLATQRVPDDVDVLVLAAPRSALLPGEIGQLRTFLQTGGSLLWLSDPDLPEQAELASMLGIRSLPGTILYRDHELLGTGHPALVLVASYPDHPAARNFAELTAFPLTGALDADTPWQPLLSSIERSWLETGTLDDNARFDPGQDRAGPLLFGISRDQQQAGQTQRIAVIADSDFLSNAYLGQLGNRAFALRLFQWLAQRDAQLDIDLPLAPDRQLQLTPLQTRALAFGFVMVLPALLILFGSARWALRRRRR